MAGNIDTISYDIVEKNDKITSVARRKANMQCTINDLLVALHDAINSPKGAVPESADDFYCHRYYTDKFTTDHQWGGEYK